MTRKCNLIIDSCCDLPPELLRHEGVSLLHFPYTLGDAQFEDDLFQTLSAEDFYNDMRKGAQPKTAQLSIPLLTGAFEAAAADGTPTVYLSFTSGLSGSYDVAMLVKDQVLEKHPGFELYVVDTRLASIAEGVLVLGAIEQMENGLTAEELATWAEEARNFVDCEFMVEDLESLRRGGRIPAGVAVAGAALDVKPLLTIDPEGKLKLVGIARGRKKGIRQLAEYFKKNVEKSAYYAAVAIGNSDAKKDMSKLGDLITKEDDSMLLVECNIGPVIGSHVGPGMVAVAFWGSDKRETLSVADRIAKNVKGRK